MTKSFCIILFILHMTLICSKETDAPEYTFLGEGSCAQVDGLDVLRYRVIFQQLAGNTISNKKGIVSLILRNL